MVRKNRDAGRNPLARPLTHQKDLEFEMIEDSVPFVNLSSSNSKFGPAVLKTKASGRRFCLLEGRERECAKDSVPEGGPKEE